MVRRIPDLNPSAKNGQATLFDTWRFHAFFTTTDPAVADTVAADKTHRGHAIIEQVHADLKNSALAHMPSGKFTANAAWLVLAVMAFNLTRAAATITGPALAKATTATIRRKLIAVRPGSPPRHDGSPCTSRPGGPGRTPGDGSSLTAKTRHRSRPTDHRRHRHDQGHNGTTRQRGRSPSHAHTIESRRHSHRPYAKPAHRWIEA